MVVSTLTLAEINEVGGNDIGWLVSRGRYDASRLAEHAVAFGVDDDIVGAVAAGDVMDVPTVT